MTTEPEEQDGLEWDQAAYWQAQPEPPEPADPRAGAGDEADPPRSRPIRRRRLRTALRTLSAARLQPAAHAWNRLMERVRQARPARLRGVGLAGAGSGLVALVAVTVVAGSVALVSYYGPGAITASAGGNPSPSAIGEPPSDDIPLPSASPSGKKPSASPSASPSKSKSHPKPGRSGTHGLERRSGTPLKARARAVNPEPAAADSPRTLKGYRLVNNRSGKPIGVASGSTANGAKIVQGSTSSTWRLVSVGSGYYNLVNRATGKALDNPDGSQSDGKQMQQWTIEGYGNANQQWYFSAAGDGYYLIVNRASGRALDLRDGNVSDGAAIQQWEPASSNPNQRWRLTAVY